MIHAINCDIPDSQLTSVNVFFAVSKGLSPRKTTPLFASTPQLSPFVHAAMLFSTIFVGRLLSDKVISKSLYKLESEK